METAATTNKKIKRKRSFWTVHTENVFVELWGEKMDELRGKRKNSHIYKEMAAELAKNGLEISPEEVKAKITNLTVKFRQENDTLIIFFRLLTITIKVLVLQKLQILYWTFWWISV